MLKGGYQIIDFSNFRFTNRVPLTVGLDVYNRCLNTKKAILVSGLTIDGYICKDSFADVTMNESTIVLKALNGYTIEINSYGVATAYEFMENSLIIACDYTEAQAGTNIEIPDGFHLIRIAVNTNVPILILDNASRPYWRYNCNIKVDSDNDSFTLQVLDSIHAWTELTIGTDNIMRRSG